MTIAIAYLLGSIPFGLLLTRLAGLGDIRATGSGNIGATNVMRRNKWLGIVTLLLDGGKGFLAVWLAQQWQESIYLAGAAAVLGHVFPVWLKFKGGKGVATALGVIFALQPIIGLVFCGFWLVMLLVKGYVSAASIGAMWFIGAVAPAITTYEKLFSQFWFYLPLALLITWTHRANIVRLKAGTEPKFGRKS